MTYSRVRVRRSPGERRPRGERLRATSGGGAGRRHVEVPARGTTRRHAGHFLLLNETASPVRRPTLTDRPPPLSSSTPHPLTVGVAWRAPESPRGGAVSPVWYDFLELIGVAPGSLGRPSPPQHANGGGGGRCGCQGPDMDTWAWRGGGEGRGEKGRVTPSSLLFLSAPPPFSQPPRVLCDLRGRVCVFSSCSSSSPSDCHFAEKMPSGESFKLMLFPRTGSSLSQAPRAPLSPPPLHIYPRGTSFFSLALRHFLLPPLHPLDRSLPSPPLPLLRRKKILNCITAVVDHHRCSIEKKKIRLVRHI